MNSGWREISALAVSPYNRQLPTHPPARPPTRHPPTLALATCRSPFLLHNAEMREALQDAGFQYDSSIPDTPPSLISPSVSQRGWPYKMDEGIPQICNTGGCWLAGWLAGSVWRVAY